MGTGFCHVFELELLPEQGSRLFILVV
uniref:Uncharacterized protein n=1 Tax=Arundo donax TaxID=35708 RepID=A0A0A9A7T2_ARUDO